MNGLFLLWQVLELGLVAGRGGFWQDGTSFAVLADLVDVFHLLGSCGHFAAISAPSKDAEYRQLDGKLRVPPRVGFH